VEVSKWIIRASFAATWIACWLFLIAAESPLEWFVVSCAVVLTPFWFVPLLEAVDG
jgi:Na+/proline symporter